MNKFQHIFQIKVRIHEICALGMLFFAWVLSLVFRQKKLWLFKERGIDARDNGYWFFKYIKEQHPEIKAEFIISNDSPDRSRLNQWPDSIIEYNSFKHYLRLWQAECLVSTHMEGCYPHTIRDMKYIYEILSQIAPKFIVDIKHGIIKDDILHYHHSKKNNLNLLICGAQQEYEFICQKYGYPKDVPQLTGLARFDQLNNFTVKFGQILLMPTWRRWYAKGIEMTETEYFHTYKQLLESKKLHQVLNRFKINLVFYPHHEIQPYINEFKKLDLPPSIIIADKAHYDVQQLLKESALLITDYSSVFFDFAYMLKPQIYFQFDEKEYRQRHYIEGYFNYRDGFGSYTTNIAELIEEIEKAAIDNFQIPSKYKRKVLDFFPFHDTHNCDRIYDTIIQRLQK